MKNDTILILSSGCFVMKSMRMLVNWSGSCCTSNTTIIAPIHLFFAYFRGLISENHCSLLDLAIATYIDPELSRKLEAN